MVKTRQYQYAISGRIIDLCVTLLAMVLAYAVKQYCMPHSLRGVSTETEFMPIIILVTGIWTVVFHYLEIPLVVNRVSFVASVKNLPKALGVCFLALSLLLYLFKIQGVSRIYISLFLFFDGALLVIVRYAYFTRLSDLYPLHRLLVVVIGVRTAAKEVIQAISKELEGVEILGCLDTDSSSVGQNVTKDIKVIGTVDELEEMLTTHVVDELLFVVPLQQLPSLDRYMRAAEIMGVKIRIIPHWHMRRYLSRRPKYYNMSFEFLGKVPSLVLSASPWNRLTLASKSVFDFSVSALLLLLLAPVMVGIGMAIKRISPGPALYRQVRCGLYGRRFSLYKFRTMVHGADEMLDKVRNRNVASGPVFKSPDDSRIISGIGTFLRKTGLDELPQLINVIKGEMSLVGPRPPIPEEVGKYDLWQRRRLSMKPGITCLWQISRGRHYMPFEQWMALDLAYIDGWSLWLDLKILFKTLASPFSHGGM